MKKTSLKTESKAKTQDLQAAEALWEALKDKFDNLSPDDVTRIFIRHGFRMDTSSGSSHYNMQPPEAISGLGSFTMTPSLSKYLLKKMLERNFDKFFERFSVQNKAAIQPKPKIKSTASSSSGVSAATPIAAPTAAPTATPTVASPIAHTETEQIKAQKIIARAYREFAQKKKKYLLYQKIIALWQLKEPEELKTAITELEARSREYPDLLPLLYFLALDLYDSIEESAPTIEKLMRLCAHPMMQHITHIQETITHFIYHHYADHIGKLTERLSSDDLTPKERFCLIESCMTLHLHVISMLEPPIELCKLQYPIPLLKNIDPEWYYEITRTGQSFVSASGKILQDIFNDETQKTGLLYTFKPLVHNESSSASSASSSSFSAAAKNQSIELARKTNAYVAHQAKDAVAMAAPRVLHFDWHTLAYFISQTRITQNEQLEKHMPERRSPDQEIYFLESAIALLNFAAKSPAKNIKAFTTVTDIKNEAFYVGLALTDALIKQKNNDKACQVFITALKAPATYTQADTDAHKKLILNELAEKLELLSVYLLEHFDKNDNLNTFFTMNNLFSLNYKTSVYPTKESIKKIIGMLQISSKNIKYLDLKLNANEQKIVDTFISESEKFITHKSKINDPVNMTILPAIDDFQALLARKGWKPDTLQNQVDAKWKAVQESCVSSSASSSSKQKKKK